jgi:anti-sigma regulatory factor (Ser/Thr protein kinase)
MDKRIQLELRNDLAELASLAAAVERFGEETGLGMKEVFNLNLVLDELLTNIITHGYVDGAEHQIRILLHRQGAWIRAEVIDNAPAFNPLQHAAPNLEEPLEGRAMGGLGIHFVRQLMDDVKYERVDGQNHLHLAKRHEPQ